MWVEQLAQAHSSNQGVELFADAVVEAPPQASPPQLKNSTDKVKLTDYQQQDPFDPDFFNHRYAEREEVVPDQKPLDLLPPPPLAVPED